MTGYADRPWLKHVAEEQRQDTEHPPSVPRSFPAAAVGVPDAYRGESVKAYVGLRPGAEADPAALVAYREERPAAHTYPGEVEVLAGLPKAAAGKILRRELGAAAG